MADCYYCGNEFVDGDFAVPVPIVRYESQEHGGALWQEQETVKVHQACLGNP